jgi:hypothetical protein
MDKESIAFSASLKNPRAVFLEIVPSSASNNRETMTSSTTLLTIVNLRGSFVTTWEGFVSYTPLYRWRFELTRQ